MTHTSKDCGGQLLVLSSLIEYYCENAVLNCIYDEEKTLNDNNRDLNAISY